MCIYIEATPSNTKRFSSQKKHDCHTWTRYSSEWRSMLSTMLCRHLLAEDNCFHIYATNLKLYQQRRSRNLLSDYNFSLARGNGSSSVLEMIVSAVEDHETVTPLSSSSYRLDCETHAEKLEF